MPISRRTFLIRNSVTAFGATTAATGVLSQTHDQPADLDRKVLTFLASRRASWNQGINLWNVRYEDGQALHHFVVQNRFKQLLEVGTSTGHAAIWLAWAAAKTGGRLTTIEIDRSRHEEALRNFRLAGVEGFVDARLADAHDLVKQLPGPWDFVFQDADKEGYLDYWNNIKGKLSSKACYSADNVLRPGAPQVTAFVRAAQRDPAFLTRIDDLGSGEGVLLACRKG